MTIVPASKATDNTFRKLWDAGFRRTVPIVPPDAELSERSSLFIRMRNGKSDGRGKSPGVKGDDGLWRGMDFVKHEAAESDLDAWHAMGAGTGIKTGQGLYAIDADTINEEWADRIEQEVAAVLGVLPTRVGRAPKRLYLLRLSEPLPYTAIKFDDGTEFGPGKEPRVELLGDGRQFVASGIHPGTKAPYTWPVKLVPLDKVPEFPASKMRELLERLRAILPASNMHSAGTPGEAPNQGSLRGDPLLVASAVAALPNTSEVFPLRDDYIEVGYAIKAALPDDEPLAFSLYREWAAKWPDNAEEVIEADWRRMKPPFRVGADTLYRMAEEHAQWDGRVRKFFSNVDSATSSASDSTPASINWLRPNDWASREPPVLEWLAKDWIPADGIVTLLYGDGGTGKTRLAQELAACMAAGGTAAGYSWLGQTTAAGRVMCFFCEDSEDELWRRQLAINRRMGLTMADIDANFRLTSRVSEENLLMTWDRASGTAKLLPTWHQLRADAIAFKPDLIITDTIADTFGGSEIERAQVNAFVKGCLGRLGRETGCKAMLALGHPSVAGMASGSGTSGSTGWSNAVRSRLYLSRVDGAANKDIRELTGKKLNVGADGAMLKLKWRNDGFDVVAGNVPGDGASSFDQISDMNERCVVAALRECADRSLSPSPNAANYAPKILKRIAAKTLETLKVEEIEAALLRLQSRGAIVYEVVGRNEDSKPVRGIRLVEDKLSENTADIFS